MNDKTDWFVALNIGIFFDFYNLFLAKCDVFLSPALFFRAKRGLRRRPGGGGGRGWRCRSRGKALHVFGKSAAGFGKKCCRFSEKAPALFPVSPAAFAARAGGKKKGGHCSFRGARPVGDGVACGVRTSCGCVRCLRPGCRFLPSYCRRRRRRARCR